MVRHQFAVGRRAGLLALVAFTTACSDRSLPSGPSLSPGMVGRLLTCAADVRAQTLSCTAPGVGGGSGKLSADLVLGGQGIYVALRSSAVSYDGTSTFQADVTVQNLTAVPLGTADGTTVTGVKVFFSSGPSLVSGTGTVSVLHPDGLGTFTGANQPFFLYNEILQTGQVSAPRTWQWTVPNTVTTFAFQVLVDAASPQEHTVLRWSRQLGTGTYWAVWGATGNDVFAVGDDGSIWHYDGTSWTAQPSGTTQVLYGVWGSGRKDVFAVGTGGTILHYDGTSWTVQPSGTPQDLYGVWGSGGTEVFAVGADGTILHYDGTSWTAQASGTTAVLYGVWGSGGTDVFAVGTGGTIVHYNGTGWTAQTSGTSAYLYGVWGSGGTDVFAVGSDFVNGGAAILHYDGASWTAQPTGATLDLYGVWGSGGTNVFAVGRSGPPLHHYGPQCAAQPSGPASGADGG